MKRLIRITTALTALLAVALQLPLAGEAAACQAEMGSHMAEMAQPASPMTGHADGSEVSPSMPGMAKSHSSGEQPPCDDDAELGACVEMAACLSSLTIPASTTSATSQRVPAHVEMISVSEPTSPVLPPEPPPPRV